jgi:hypothetical protein
MRPEEGSAVVCMEYTVFILVIKAEGCLIATSFTQEVLYTYSSSFIQLQRTVNRILWRK